MVPLLKFFHHDDCRTAATNSLPDPVRCIMESGKELNGSQVASFVQFVLPQLLDAIKTEPELEVLVHMVDALAQIVTTVGPPAIPAEIMPNVVQSIALLLLESEARNMDRERLADQEDWDEEAHEDAEADEAREELLSKMTAAVSGFLRNYAHHGFVQAFKTPYELGEESEQLSLMKIFWMRLQSRRPASERQAALCVFDDLISFGGQEGVNIVQGILPTMRVYCLDPDGDVRQAAGFGIGVCAQVGGEKFASDGGSGVVSELERVIRDPHA